jgi:hypothetical protein
MPTYCYITNDGTIVERFMGMHEDHPQVITLADGTTAERCLAAESKSLQTETNPGWPMEPCTASGVQPWQANELRDHLKKRGVPTDVTPQGDPIYRSKSHRSAALKARGMHDRADFN